MVDEHQVRIVIEPEFGAKVADPQPVFAFIPLKPNHVRVPIQRRRGDGFEAVNEIETARRFGPLEGAKRLSRVCEFHNQFISL